LKLQKAEKARKIGPFCNFGGLDRGSNPPATRRRALKLLAGSRDGCTEAIMIEHGFPLLRLKLTFPTAVQQPADL
jgi:hypothetical protein